MERIICHDKQTAYETLIALSNRQSYKGETASDATARKEKLSELIEEVNNLKDGQKLIANYKLFDKENGWQDVQIVINLYTGPEVIFNDYKIIG